MGEWRQQRGVERSDGECGAADDAPGAGGVAAGVAGHESLTGCYRERGGSDERKGSEGGDVVEKFNTFTNEKVRGFLKASIVPMLPRNFFTGGGLTVDEYVDRFSSHSDVAASEDRQFFTGTWTSRNGQTDEIGEVTLKLSTRRDAVFGQICLSQRGGKCHERKRNNCKQVNRE